MQQTDLIKLATSQEFALWAPYSRLGDLYQRQLNCKNKRKKLDYLVEFHHTALHMAKMIGRMLTDAEIHSKNIRSIESALRPTIHTHWLNLTHLYQGFILPGKKTEDQQVQYLTSMYYLLNDLAAIALVTNCEPEYLLEVTGE
jgi:hypothetical protein